MRISVSMPSAIVCLCAINRKWNINLLYQRPASCELQHGVVLSSQEGQVMPWRNTLSMRTKLLRGGAGAFMLGMDMRERHIS